MEFGEPLNPHKATACHKEQMKYSVLNSEL